MPKKSLSSKVNAARRKKTVKTATAPKVQATVPDNSEILEKQLREANERHDRELAKVLDNMPGEPKVTVNMDPEAIGRETATQLMRMRGAPTSYHVTIERDSKQRMTGAVIEPVQQKLN